MILPTIVLSIDIKVILLHCAILYLKSRSYQAFLVLGLTMGSGCIYLYIYRMFSVRETVRKNKSPYGYMNIFT